MTKQAKTTEKPRKPNVFKKCGPKLTQKDLERFEKEVGLRLPPSFRAHYVESNGGIPTRRYYVTAKGDEYEVASFRRIKHRAKYEPLINETYEMLAIQRGIVPRRLLPFAADSGGDLYCMDMKTETIWVWAADDYKKGNPESAATRIAPSLASFIEGMVTEPEAYG
jgi:hypothetical protein